jgi:D-alanyl-D-alanine carboxypeptidase/D-alanyl-D-alanine-endopeptidase (penicillin-binding protein 4)
MSRSFSRVLPLLFCLLVPAGAWSQTVSAKLAAAYHIFQDDPQLRNAVSSLYVQDAKTGRVVFDKNGLVGLAPASTMKVITSISAYELLGRNFRYETKFARQQNQQQTALVILPGGDPTLGSWRWRATREEAVLHNLTQAIQKAGITAFSAVYVDNQGWEEAGSGRTSAIITGPAPPNSTGARTSSTWCSNRAGR